MNFHQSRIDGQQTPSAGSRRVSGLVRTLLVAASTLALLLVVFSVYQHSQLAEKPKVESVSKINDRLSSRGPRLPASPDEVPAVGKQPPDASGSTGSSPQAAQPSSTEGVIGPGQNITMTLYPPQGTKARMELTVSDWAPKDGSDREFVLRNPEVRMRTRDGNGVRVTAREGLLEAQRKGPGSLDPQRGRLSGDVVIEYDRRGDAEKAKLPPETRDKPEPSDIVRIEMDEVEFDMQYDRLWVPGPVKVIARDAELTAGDVEIRFERSGGRVQSMRIGRGGKLELLAASDRLGLAMPGVERDASVRTSIVEWVRASIEARFVPSSTESRASSTKQPKKSSKSGEEDGVPVFRGGGKEPSPGESEMGISYLARFEGDIDARQQVGDVTQSRLQADALEILRDFSNKDKERAKTTSASEAPTKPAAQDAAPPKPQQRIVLTWSSRMVLDAVAPDGEASSPRARVSATGNPARISSPDGEAICSKLTYSPDTGEVALEAAGNDRAIVRSENQGGLSGRQVHLRQNDNTLEVSVTGPGTVEGVTSDQIAESPVRKGASGSIDFSGNLVASGRREKHTNIDFTGGNVTQTQSRVLDRATFSGRTTMHMDDATLEADEFEVGFAPRRGWRGMTQTIERLHGRGNVVMITDKDRLECPDLDVAFATESDGRVRPTSAVATGPVRAQQGASTLEASQKLVVDFERLSEQAASGPSLSASANIPLEAAKSSTGKAGKKAKSPSRDRVAARRLRAYGDVTIIDPSRPIDLQAEEIDCIIAGGADVEKAVLIGRAEAPAHALLETFSVTGERVTIDVPNQWADVPGAGRMTFLSGTDLDGKKAKEPVPIAVTWKDSMKCRGRENRATFTGEVHATSKGTTSFDAQQLQFEFDDIASTGPVKEAEASRGWITDPLMRGLLRQKTSNTISSQRFGKEVAAIYASGGFVAQMADVDTESGALVSRSRINGPKMSLNRKSKVMLVEGVGDLQIEDFRAPRTSPGIPNSRSQGDLFGSVEESGPSKTLIQWKELMRHDFSAQQARFEGAVRLKHLSGKQLEKVFGPSSGGSTATLPTGRSTFLNCDVLTADFREHDRRTRNADGRMGGLSSERLRQFEASGAVTLQDQTEGLALTADRVLYERAKKILAISGKPQRLATIVTQKPGKSPSQVSIERLFYDLGSGEMSLANAKATGR